jgi:hypothetical protein
VYRIRPAKELIMSCWYCADQLVCPVVDCKRSLTHRDLRRILDHEIYEQYQRTTQRVRDETSPLARWCVSPACGELIMCPSDASTFSCPSCATVGCFHCRGRAHRFAFLCRASPSKREDASYLEWERSVGDHRAVRACPQCHMRIWKNDGCNHMTCAHCFHQYCWVCDADWHRRHYACGRDADPRSDADAVRRRIAQLEILVVGAIVALLACVSAVALAPVLALVTIARRVPHLVCAVVSVVKALAVLLTLPFLLVLALSDAFLNQKPRRRRPVSWQRERSRLWKD